MKRLFFLILFIASTNTIFAQKAKEAEHKKEHKQIANATYTCPMHADVTSNAPGKCPKCDMNLTLSKKEQMKMEVMKIYTCPMHADVKSSRPGKCSKCGMALEKTKDEKRKSKLKL